MTPPTKAGQPPGKEKLKRSISNMNWTTSGIMIACFLFGIIFALVNDTIYAHFDGQPVASRTQQLWLGRTGTGLAFLIKTLFSAVSGAACVQLLWWTMRHKATAVNTIDSSFKVGDSPLALFDKSTIVNFRFFKEAPVIIFLGAISWLMPLSAIIAPPTLTVQSTLTQNITQSPVLAIDYTALLATPANKFFEYLGPQPLIKRIATLVTYQNQELTFGSPVSAPNASYVDTFYGPGLSCQANQSVVDFTMPENYTPYFACVPPDNGETALNNSKLKTIDQVSEDAAHLFIATCDNIGYESPIKVLDCSLYNASYTVLFNFSSDISSYTLQNVSMINLVPWNWSSDAYHYLNTPSTMYLSMLDALGQLLVGWILEYEGTMVTNTDILNTPLVETADFPFAEPGIYDQTIKSNKTLGTAVEELMTNMTMSLFSLADFTKNKTTYPVDITSFGRENIYQYTRWQLLTAYGIAAAFSLLSLIIDMWCPYVNQAAYSNNFSAVLRVSRDSNLHGYILDEDTSGVNPTPKHLKNSKVKLVQLNGRDDESPHFAVTVVEDADLSNEELEEGHDKTDRENREVSESGLEPSEEPLLREQDHTPVSPL